MNDLYIESENWEAFKSKYVLPSVLNKEWDLIVDCLFGGCYGFQMFTKDFCDQVINIANNENKWAEKQRESNQEYSTNDVLLNEVGLDDIYVNLLVEYVYPAIIHTYHLESLTKDKSEQDVFFSENLLVKYTLENQSHLSLHHDFSAVTTILSLNEEFEGGGTWFVNQKKLVKNKVGYMTFHPGMFSHYHGARPIMSGERYVVISFNNWIPS